MIDAEQDDVVVVDEAPATAAVPLAPVAEAGARSRFMEFDGIFMGLNGFHGILVEFHGISWIVMGSNGIQWDSIGIWRCPKIGAPPIIIHFSRIFPYKPSIHFGVPLSLQSSVTRLKNPP